MTDEQIDALVFDIEEIVCTPGYITKPADWGCRYGITEGGEKELTTLLKSKLQKKGK